jgi:hypothetical protein
MNAAIMLERSIKVSHSVIHIKTNATLKEEKQKTHPTPTKSVPNNGTAQCTLLAFCAVHP